MAQQTVMATEVAAKRRDGMLHLRTQSLASGCLITKPFEAKPSAATGVDVKAVVETRMETRPVSHDMQDGNAARW